MNCPACGKTDISDDMHFCPSCGARLEGAAPQPQPAVAQPASMYAAVQQAPASEQPSKKARKPGKGKNIFIIILVVLLILEGLFITGWFLDTFSMRQKIQGATSGEGKADATKQQAAAIAYPEVTAWSIPADGCAGAVTTPASASRAVVTPAFSPLTDLVSGHITGGAEGSSADSGSTAESGSALALTEDGYVTSDGYITISAAYLLDGSDLAALLEDQGYEYDAKKGDVYEGFFVKDGDTEGAIAFANDLSADATYTEDELARIDDTVDAIGFIQVVFPEDTDFDDWLDAQGVELVKSEHFDDGDETVAIVTIGDAEYLLDAFDDGEGAMRVSLMSDAACLDLVDTDAEGFYASMCGDEGDATDGSADSSATSSSASDSSASADSSSAMDASDGYLDASGNITLSGIFGLTGSELSDLLDEQGYTFDDKFSDEFAGCFVRDGHDGVVLKLCPGFSASYTADDLDGLDKGSESIGYVACAYPSGLSLAQWLATQGVKVVSSCTVSGYDAQVAIVSIDGDEYFAMSEPYGSEGELMECIVASDTAVKDAYGYDVETLYKTLSADGSAEGGTIS